MSRYRVLNSNVVIRGQYYVIQLKSSLVNREDLIQKHCIGTGTFTIADWYWIGVYQPQLIQGNLESVLCHTLQKLRNYRMEQEEKLEFDAK